MPHPIHHITAVASDPARCVQFYSHTLGLRLVKKTVNQDQTEAYHLFFGDTMGSPGMDLTFFTFPGVGAGAAGVGGVSSISFAVPAGSLQFWRARFDSIGVPHEEVAQTATGHSLTLYDPDQLQLVLVEVPDSEFDSDLGTPWETAEISTAHAIRSFHSARMRVAELGSIEPIITAILGFEPGSRMGAVQQYQIPDGTRASRLEVVADSEGSWVRPGAGTVHHIAFQVVDEAELVVKQQELLRAGLRPTTVIDRYYFKSVYVWTPAGILFELATNGPGFTADEPEATLGEALSLPPFLEPYRERIEAKLPPIADVTQ